MKKINNILVASELNKESYEALAYGIALGLMYEAKVSCIHVVKDSPIDFIKETFRIGSAKYGEALIEAKEESQSLLRHIIDVIAKELGVGEVEVDLKIVNGTLSKSIMDYAEKINADMVIIGAEPGARLSRTPHTNLAINMIALEKANVLLIPSEFKMERIEQYGAFVNFEVEEIDFIHKMIKHARKTDNLVKLIYVIEPGVSISKIKALKKSFERLLASELNQNKIKFILEIGPVPQVVNALKTKHNIDLMFMRAYKRHWDMFSTSTAFSDKVIKNIKCPLVICKTTKKAKKIKMEVRT